jgi:hypothetical protein
MAKPLGESLRQCFQQCGLLETAGMLGQFCSEMQATQRRLVNVLPEAAHPDGGVIDKVRSANDSLLRSMTTRAQHIVDLLGRLGFFLGTWFASQHRRNQAQLRHNRGWRLPTHGRRHFRS